MEIDPLPPISEMTDPITETDGVARDIPDAPTAPGGGGAKQTVVDATALRWESVRARWATLDNTTFTCVKHGSQIDKSG